MDIIDEANYQAELFLQAQLAIRKPTVPPCGECHNCKAPVPDQHLFCDRDCAADFERRASR